MKQFRIVVMTIFIMVPTLIGQHSVAQYKHAFVTPLTNKVQYLGMENDMLIFEIHFQNSKRTVLYILDQSGNEIYSEDIETALFTKRYKIVRKTISKIQFIIKGKQQILNESFTITSKVEEKLLVSKL